MPYLNDSGTVCNSPTDYQVSSESNYIEAPALTITMDFSGPKLELYLSDAPNTNHNVTFYLFVKSCSTPYKYKLVGPLSIVGYPVITASTFDSN